MFNDERKILFTLLIENSLISGCDKNNAVKGTLVFALNIRRSLTDSCDEIAFISGFLYCLNVNKDIYENICINLLGTANDIISLKKSKRQNNYEEFIYIWYKN